MADLGWMYGLLSFANNSGWYDFRENPYPFYDTRDVDTIAVVLQEHGKTLERPLPRHTGMGRSHGQFTWPLALNLMTSAADIDQVKDGSAYVNVVGAEGRKQLYDILCTGLGRSQHLYPPA